MATLDREHVDYTPGAMEIDEQKATYAVIMRLTKWSALACAVLLLFLSVWFGTEAGFFTAFLTAVVVGVAGWFLLRGKPQDAPPH